jgi:Phage minor capsid protein 2
MSLDLMTQGQRGRANLNTRVMFLTARYERAESILMSLVSRAVIAGTMANPKVQRAIKQQTATMMAELDKAGIPEGQAIVEKAYALGVKLAASTNPKLVAIDDSALDLLKTSLSARLTDATTHVGRRVDDVFRKEGLKAAAAALGDQELPDPSDYLQKRLINQGVSAFTDKDGRNWGLADYAGMAVRTTVTEAVFQATQSHLLASNLDVVQINSVDNPCDLCAPWDGGTFSLTGRSNYPLLTVTMPIHPRCGHFMVAAPEAVAERRSAA